MPFTDKNGKQWPDTQVIDGVKLILDPMASIAAKRPKYRPDPKQQKEYAYNYGFAERPKEPASALEGLGMVGASAAAGVLGQQLGGGLGSSLAGKTAETGLSEVSKNALAQQGAMPGAVPATPTGVEANLVQTAPVDAGMGATPFYVPAAAAIGTYLAGKSAYDMIKGKEEDKSVQGKAGRGQLAFTTMGLSEVARGLGLGRKSTKDIQQDRRNNLLDQGITGYESYLNTAGTDAGGIAPVDAGFEASRDEGLLTPEQIWGSEAMFETFGNDWLGSLNESQRRDISAKLLQNNLIREKQGGIYITDEAKAKTIKDEVLGKKQPAANSLAQAGAIARPVVSNQAFRR